MKIGNVEIKGYAALAPMAGVADRAFRELCTAHGAAMTVGELTSAKGVSMNNAKSMELLRCSDRERPYGSQIFGSDPKLMAEAAKAALNFSPDFIDINMGCPAPKVISSGGGSALLKNPKLAGEIVKAVVDAVDIPVTAKIRIGYNNGEFIATEMAKYIEDSGASAITVHGRTREQMYAPPVNIDAIAAVKAAVSIPVIGNGDIFNAFDAAKMYEQTNCDLVMVGRGALGNPFIFSEINAYLNGEHVMPTPAVSVKMVTMLEHVKKMIEYKGEKIALKEARKHAAWYIKGIHGAAAYRKMCGEITEFSDLERLAFLICNENAK